MHLTLQSLLVFKFFKDFPMGGTASEYHGENVWILSLPQVQEGLGKFPNLHYAGQRTQGNNVFLLLRLYPAQFLKIYHIFSTRSLETKHLNIHIHKKSP